MPNNEQELADLMKQAKEALGAQAQEPPARPTEDIYEDFRMLDDMMAAAQSFANADEPMPDADMEGSSEPIYPGGPPMGQVEAWQKVYGNVYHVRILDRDFVFRCLSRLEYKRLVSLPNTDPLMREEMICNLCTLFPAYGYEDMAKDKAGYVSSLSQIIMENSGFTTNYQIEIL